MLYGDLKARTVQSYHKWYYLRLKRLILFKAKRKLATKGDSLIFYIDIPVTSFTECSIKLVAKTSARTLSCNIKKCHLPGLSSLFSHFPFLFLVSC